MKIEVRMRKAPMHNVYYTHPVQVKYWDTDLKKYVGGIGYHEVIICGCCGKVCSIAEIIDEAEKYYKMDPDKAIIEMNWIDISQEIIG
jgi:hypothetical protein